MKTLAVVAILLAQENQLIFESPKGTTDPDRLKAAKALAARCVAHGFKDVTGDTARPAPDAMRQVRLLSTKGFTKEMYPAIDFLATFTCRKVELRFERFLSKAEMDEYKEGEKAPKGTTWTKHRIWKLFADPFPHYRPTEEDEVSLFLDKPVIDAAGKWRIHRHAGGDLFGHERPEGVFLIFKGSMVKTIYGGIVPNPEKPKQTMLPINLFIDGVRFPTDGGSMGWRSIETKVENPDMAIWEFPEMLPTTPIVWLLENPLPFALKRVE
jgi:hypothetical protein